MEEQLNSRPGEVTEEVLTQLRWLPWANQLEPEILRDIAETAEIVKFEVGEQLPTVEGGIPSLFFVVSGRVEVEVYDSLENLVGRYTYTRGRALGLFSLGYSDHSHLRAEAVEPTSTIQLRRPDLLRLTCKHTELQLTLIRLAAGILKTVYAIDRALPKPNVVGIYHQSPATRPLTARLVARLAELGESLAVVGDEPEFRSDTPIRYRQVIKDGQVISPEERRRLLNAWSDCTRLLIDVEARYDPQTLRGLTGSADMILWCLRPSDAAAAVPVLQAMERDVPKWREKIRIVWVLDPDNPSPPYHPELDELAARDFKLTLTPATTESGGLLSRGLERVVHHLRGIQIGLALGGGAARGMAHLGVLKALEQHGVDVDMIAGTSAGAMTGILYASGMQPEAAIENFKNDLKLNWLFRQLPAGGYWYLLYKYRRNQFEPMLRKYLDQNRMEQLLMPAFTVSVDLVEGEHLVRGTGDAVDNILESINLPPLALPILRTESALVDGGLLNNVPADVLVANGCNFVIASSVTAKLEKDFMGIRSQKNRFSSRLFATVQVIMRQNMVQSYNMNYVGVQPADLMIAPDVTAFDLSEFTRADEMAVVGEAAADNKMPDLVNLLAKIDPQMFRPTATARV